MVIILIPWFNYEIERRPPVFHTAMESEIMEKIDWKNRFLAFKGDKLIADGKQLEVALKLKADGAEPALRRG